MCFYYMNSELTSKFFDASFIQDNTPVPDKDTPEEMARKIARQEDRLVEALIEKLGSETRMELVFGVNIYHDPTSLTFTSHVERLVPMDFSKRRTVSFTHQLFEGISTMQRALGINTPNALFVQSPEDERTKDKLYSLLNEDPSVVDLLGTYYFFSPDGKFFKVASLPMKVDDDRESILPPFANRKFVRSEINNAEFYGAHSVLSLVRAYLK